MKLLSRRILILGVLLAGANPIPAFAKECKVHFLSNARAREDRTVIALKGETRYGATQYVVDKISGASSICFHGGYCYEPASAIKLVGCTVDWKGYKSEDVDEKIYYLK